MYKSGKRDAAYLETQWSKEKDKSDKDGCESVTLPQLLYLIAMTTVTMSQLLSTMLVTMYQLLISVATRKPAFPQINHKFQLLISRAILPLHSKLSNLCAVLTDQRNPVVGLEIKGRSEQASRHA